MNFRFWRLPSRRFLVLLGERPDTRQIGGGECVEFDFHLGRRPGLARRLAKHGV